MVRKLLKQEVRNGVFAVIVIGLLVMAILRPAIATHSPANKASASGRKTMEVGPGVAREIMKTTMRTSSPADVILNVSLECTILTALKTNNENPVSNAESTVRIWVTIDDKIVRISDTSAPGDNTLHPGDDTDKVVFCNREYQRSVSDQEDPNDGVDEIDDYIKTKSSHSFQWLALNLGNGIHTIRVLADLEQAVPTGSGTAEAIVGNRTLIVEPTHVANDAVIN
ncbi:MAG: hypothetical protein ABR548_05455 [Actinomycetota bacterium]|nr:hypothetical protein [Actinomycetota bacterium]